MTRNNSWVPVMSSTTMAIWQTFRPDTGKNVRMFLVNNPSHLEAVDPVAEGVVRARQDLPHMGGGESGSGAHSR